MKTKTHTLFKSMSLLFLGLLLSNLKAGVHHPSVDFESDRWIVTRGEIVNHLGRKSLAGSAYLKDVEFENGVIEVDVAVSGARSYPGINFRMQTQDNGEHVYIRPHRAGLYPDAVQYAPIFNGVGGWQLYHGEGFTAGAAIPARQWIPLKMEISGTQARVYLNNAPEPALTIHNLKHGNSKGKIGVSGPANKTAYFSNFRYHSDDTLQWGPPPQAPLPAHMVTGWKISQAFAAGQIDLTNTPYPRFFQFQNIDWQPVRAEASGLINISRTVKRSGSGPDLIFARTVIRSDKKEVVKLSFGYSDEIAIFLNGKKIVYGNSAYRFRDPSFLGLVGLNDAVYLTLEKGVNEIFLMVKETFGGWGFICQADRQLLPPEKAPGQIEKVWETPPRFLTPESVLYDAQREILYVTNFDSKFKMSAAAPGDFTGFISRVSLDGKIKDLKWVTGLHAPSGMCLYQDKLYAVERRSLVEIDTGSGRMIQRYPIPGADFLNDLVTDTAGNIYISDTTISPRAESCIYKFKDGQSEVWFKGDAIQRPNGLYLQDNHLLVCNTGDGCLKSIQLDTKTIDTIACLGAWVLDGIGMDTRGNWLISQWPGMVYRVSPGGRVTELLDTLAIKANSADFAFINEKNLLIIPTYNQNRLMAYRLRSADE
jgi:hypothetical protein